LIVDNVLERWYNLFPCWVVLWESIDGEDLGQLDNVHNFELLELEIGIKSSVVELSQESH